MSAMRTWLSRSSPDVKGGRIGGSLASGSQCGHAVWVTGTGPSERPWPTEGNVAIVGAEAQDHVLLPVEVVEALPASERKVLARTARLSGSQLRPCETSSSPCFSESPKLTERSSVERSSSPNTRARRGRASALPHRHSAPNPPSRLHPAVAVIRTRSPPSGQPRLTTRFFGGGPSGRPRKNLQSPVHRFDSGRRLGFCLSAWAPPVGPGDLSVEARLGCLRWWYVGHVETLAAPRSR